MRLGLILPLAVCCLTLVGCGGANGPKKQMVTGKVTFENTPIDEGRITFRGQDGKIGSYSAPIKNGSYSVEAEVGSYTVEITASRMTGKFVTTIEGKSEVGEMYIPEKYNSKSKLQKEVSPSASEINFELTK
jgi:hypothetical protein